ncbi:MAG: hypothetical protein ABSA07_03360 [Acidimicrobiales bacterium]|jgi:hypothetical protein
MKLSRLVIAVLVLVALVVLSLRTTSSAASANPPVPCTTAALGQAFDGEFHLSSIQNYGCEGEWAYAWATVGTGQEAIGVTEVLAYNESSEKWALVSRATDCKATILPSVIYHQGCFSN